MTTSKSLPARPSQEFLRKQAKKLVREIAAGNRNRGAYTGALLDLDPAFQRRSPPPHSQSIEFALGYAKTHPLDRTSSGASRARSRRSIRRSPRLSSIVSF